MTDNIETIVEIYHNNCTNVVFFGTSLPFSQVKVIYQVYFLSRNACSFAQRNFYINGKLVP